MLMISCTRLKTTHSEMCRVGICYLPIVVPSCFTCYQITDRLTMFEHANFILIQHTDLKLCIIISNFYDDFFFLEGGGRGGGASAKIVKCRTS